MSEEYIHKMYKDKSQFIESQTKPKKIKMTKQEVKMEKLEPIVEKQSVKAVIKDTKTAIKVSKFLNEKCARSLSGKSKLAMILRHGRHSESKQNNQHFKLVH